MVVHWPNRPPWSDAEVLYSTFAILPDQHWTHAGLTGGWNGSLCGLDCSLYPHLVNTERHPTVPQLEPDNHSLL